MSLLSLASAASLSRGYAYYEEHKVISWAKEQDEVFRGVVAGSNGERYAVTIDIGHPRRNSVCSCPYADGKRRICKHMVAMYFTVFPTEAESYYRETVLAEEEAEKEAERLENAVIKHVRDMNREQLEISLLTLLFEGPEWQMRRFVDEHLYPFETEVCDRIPNDAAFDPFGDENGV